MCTSDKTGIFHFVHILHIIIIIHIIHNIILFHSFTANVIQFFRIKSSNGSLCVFLISFLDGNSPNQAVSSCHNAITHE